MPVRRRVRESRALIWGLDVFGKFSESVEPGDQIAGLYELSTCGLFAVPVVPSDACSYFQFVDDRRCGGSKLRQRSFVGRRRSRPRLFDTHWRATRGPRRVAVLKYERAATLSRVPELRSAIRRKRAIASSVFPRRSARSAAVSSDKAVQPFESRSPLRIFALHGATFVPKRKDPARSRVRAGTTSFLEEEFGNAIAAGRALTTRLGPVVLQGRRPWPRRDDRSLRQDGRAPRGAVLQQPGCDLAKPERS